MTREAYEGMAKAKGISRECYEYHWNACEGRGWVDTHGNPIRNPVSLLANFARHWRPKECSRKPAEPRAPVLSDAELLRQAQQ